MKYFLSKRNNQHRRTVARLIYLWDFETNQTAHWAESVGWFSRKSGDSKGSQLPILERFEEAEDRPSRSKHKGLTWFFQEFLTCSAANLISCLLDSVHIAGTVITHMMSVWFSLNANCSLISWIACEQRYPIASENVVNADTSQPRKSLIFSLMSTFYKATVTILS